MSSRTLVYQSTHYTQGLFTERMKRVKLTILTLSCKSTKTTKEAHEGKNQATAFCPWCPKSIDGGYAVRRLWPWKESIRRAEINLPIMEPNEPSCRGIRIRHYRKPRVTSCRIGIRPGPRRGTGKTQSKPKDNECGVVCLARAH